MLQDEMIFGLRKMKGISLTYLKERYDVDIFVKYPDLKKK
jgi:oxygen-independent coproporphyrinogen III oxidase